MGTSTSSSTIAGTLTRKTEPHQKWASRTPDSTGPRATPPPMTAVQIETAVPRWRSSWKRLRISARVEGIRVAPLMPSTARAAISISAEVEYAATTDAAPNPAAPISSSRRRPIRSPSDPIVMSRPASTKP